MRNWDTNELDLIWSSPYNSCVQTLDEVVSIGDTRIISAPFELDLHEVKLYGWEDINQCERIERMVASLEDGIAVRPVFVERRAYTSECAYQLNPNIRSAKGQYIADGGHTRAVAHYILGLPMLCIAVDRGGMGSHHIAETKIRLPGGEKILPQDYLLRRNEIRDRLLHF